MLTSSTDIQYLKGVGEKRAELLRKKGIYTVGDLLRYFPRKYLDWRNITPIAEAPVDQNVCVKAKLITEVKKSIIKTGMTIFTFVAADDSGEINVTLFNQQYLAKSLRYGNEYLFYGKAEYGLTVRKMSSPVIMSGSYNGIEPIYPAAEKLSSKAIEKLVKTALQNVTEISDVLPEDIRTRNNLCDINYSIKNIHFPLTPEAFERAKERLVFEELFILQVGLMLLKKRKRGFAGCTIKKNYIDEFKAMLAFQLTNAQNRVIDECIKDMSTGRVMNRLVEGDVGSGKTAVAAALCYNIAKNGFQAALMAPTEILAEQHYKSFCEITDGTGLSCALLTGSQTKKTKTAIKEKIKNGEINIVIGTHALLTDDVEFLKLALVITDEQHRFGVAQRAKLSSKGENPHTLVMSATPIPRTLGLILYGDLDISIIDEYPKGRQVIDTYCVNSSYRLRVYNYIKRFLDEGRQAYIVCPLVEESENTDITSATEYYEKLKSNEFKEYKTALLHGKMSAAEKDRIMRKFAANEINMLISTTVIEVGIDVTNAVIMVIENAERFGLSQLHQLRGRIGRGKHKSTCILISDNKSTDTKKRLDVIKNCRDGFKIADEDLKLRGPGDFLGSRQHGLPDMKIADIFADRKTLALAGNEAKILLSDENVFKNPKNKGLKEEIISLYRKLNQN